jgi:anti-sigma factor RsiW
MNCRQAEKLLPLYAGRDLDERRAELVAAHLQSCATCLGVVAEYRETVQLTREFAAPAFGEAVYSRIRRGALREIEGRTTASAGRQMIASVFRQRLTWAAVTVLLVAVSLFGIYSITNRGNDRRQLADKKTLPVQPKAKESSGSAPQSGRGITVSSPESKNAWQQPRIAQRQVQRKTLRNAVTDRMNAVAENLPRVMSRDNTFSPQSSSLPEPELLPAGDSAPSEKTLRMEIQTKDPNIRIIWFAQQRRKPTVPASKGT